MRHFCTGICFIGMAYPTGYNLYLIQIQAIGNRILFLSYHISHQQTCGNYQEKQFSHKLRLLNFG